MPGLSCTKLAFYYERNQIDYLFGFFYCIIEAPKYDYLGILPLRDRGLIFPVGKWYGWYFSE